MRRKGRSAGYLFAASRVPNACGVFFFACFDWVVLVGSAARKVVMGRFFRLGSVHNIVADTRVLPASATSVGFRWASAGGLFRGVCIRGRRFQIGDFALHRAIVCIAPPELCIRADPTGPRRSPTDSPSGPVKISLPHYRYRV
jgi:hypothetical protein